MLKKSLLILGLLTIINSVYSSEAAKYSDESFTAIFEFNSTKGAKLNSVITCTVGKRLPFIRLNSTGEITFGKGCIRIAGEVIHEITDDPHSWISTPKLLTNLKLENHSIIRVILSTEH